jgi:excisionase family DNA binding protein
MKPDNDNDEAMLVTLTSGELKRLVRDVVRSEMQAPAAPEYLSAEQVAEMVGCTVESIRTYCSRDGLPCVRIGKLRRFHRGDILAWLEERRSRPRSHKAKHVSALANVRQLK